jgi:fatty acid desaturase
MKLLRYIFLFIIIGGAIYGLQQSEFKNILHPNIWFIFAFFLAIAFLNDQLMKIGFEKKREKFVSLFLASVVLRLVLSLLFLGIFIIIKLENPQLFTINFIVLYLCVLVFEIFENSRKLREN